MSGDAGQGFFSRHVRVHPKIVHGRFANLRIAALVATLGVLYSIPWLRWGDRPAVWLDLPRRKFHLFGLVLWPQDMIYLTALLVIAALFLFLVTALAGRIWCGYACPQTVFTQILVWIERLFEGDRAQQLRLERGGWTVERIVRQSSKGIVGIVFSVATAVSVVGYFVPIRELIPRLFAGTAAPASYLAIVAIAGAIPLFAGRMREQVCIYMCPYARFQSAMFDRDTLIVSYDEQRGEPRGPLTRGIERGASAFGSCVDCSLCVQVCPTGIDIRDGLQYQCIACASCIDACDQVMDKIGAPRGLVRYTTQDALEGRRTRIARPRVLAYGGLIALLVAALSYAIVHRVPLELDVLRDRNATYREVGDGRIENVYRLRVLNMDQIEHRYELDVEGPEGVEVVYRAGDLRLGPGEIRDLAVRVRVRPEALRQHSTKIELELRSIDEPAIAVEEESRFLGPKARPVDGVAGGRVS
jgi:cytochrome c oxidase accessory protein FixG